MSSYLTTLDYIAKQQEIINRALPPKGVLDSITNVERMFKQSGLFDTIMKTQEIYKRTGLYDTIAGTQKMYKRTGLYDTIEMYKRTGLYETIARMQGMYNRIGLYDTTAKMQSFYKQSGILKTIEATNSYNGSHWVGRLHDNNIQSIETVYSELNNSIEDIIDEVDKGTLTTELVERFIKSIYDRIRELLNDYKISRIEKMRIIGILAFILPLLYSKYLSDDSTQQIITNNNTNRTEIINSVDDRIEDAEDKIIDTFTKYHYKYLELLSETYRTVYTCKVYETAKCRTVKNQIGEGTYVHLTPYKLGSKVFINYSTEDCPEEPQSGWIDKKYIKKEAPNPNKKNKLFPIRKSK